MGYVDKKVILRRISQGFASREYIVLDGGFKLFKGLAGAFMPT